MPTALPAIEVPDYAPTLNAYRTGQQDKLAADKRTLMKEAGGLAAAGNYKDAMGSLYKGGELDEARGMGGEIRAQSAEARAAGAHARTLKNDELERASKGYELFGRLIPTIKSPEQLEMAKGMLKQRGYDFSKVTMDQLPMLQQQNISISDQFNREMEQRKLDILQQKADTLTSSGHAAKPRNLSYNDIEKLGKKGSQLENVDRYVSTFKDENAGYGVGGEKMMFIARNLPFLTGPKTENAANWWQDYDRYKNVIRNELFGSALTAGETAAFEAADVAPNMDPKLIRRNLARQQEAVKSALRKVSGGLKASGYPAEAVDAATGITDGQLESAPQVNEKSRIDLGNGQLQPKGNNIDPLGILD